MRVLVTGAYGLIGSAVLARLHRDGHDLVGTGRQIGTAQRQFPYARWVAADFRDLQTKEAWKQILTGIDAVVNCAGAFQQSLRDDLAAVHVSAPLALFAACQDLGIQRVAQISAMGAGLEGASVFAKTKGQADAALAASALPWIILRPGVVLASGVYGASAMLRGLAGLPWRTPLIAGDREVRIVSVEDLAETVAWALGPGLSVRETFELLHPRSYTVAQLVSGLRQWLGFPHQPTLELPAVVARAITAAADALAYLGWRSPARSTAFAELAAGMHGDPASWIAATGIAPKDLDAIFNARPATLQDRWFSRLYFLKPAAIACLAAFWIVSGLVVVGPGWSGAQTVLATAGMNSTAAMLIAAGGAVIDVILGIGVAIRSSARMALIGMLVVSGLYLLLGTILAPALWLDPLGRLVKIVPILLLIVFALAVLEER
jgi:uncharacterized protein YbjT (DUF2867 family)